MIDPEFWLDEDITSIDFSYRLFYIGMWNFSDDYGVIEDSPKKLKAQIFPYDDVDCGKIIFRLKGLKKLVPFDAEGKKWLYIRKFLKYQRIDKPSNTRNPEAPQEVLAEDSPSTQELFDAEVSISKVKRSKENISKKIYGEFEKVLLLDDEKEKLIEKLGEKNTNILIAELDTYIASKGKRYSSHYATMLNWAKRKFTEHKEKTKKTNIIGL